MKKGKMKMNEPSCDVKEIQELATLNGDAMYQIKTKDGKIHEVLYKYLSVDGCTKYMCGNPWTGKIYSIKQSDVKMIYYSTEEKKKEKMKEEIKEVDYSIAYNTHENKVYKSLDIQTLMTALDRHIVRNASFNDIVIRYDDIENKKVITITARQAMILLENKINELKNKQTIKVFADNACYFTYNTDDIRQTSIDKILINEKMRVVTVKFTDGDIKMAKCSEKDEFDPEVGVSLCMTYHEFGSKTKYKKYIKKNAKWIKKGQ